MQRRRINFSFAPTISRMPAPRSLPAILRKRAAKFRMQSCRNEILDRFACLLSFSFRNVNSSKRNIAIPNPSDIPVANCGPRFIRRLACRNWAFFPFVRGTLRLKMQINISTAMVTFIRYESAPEVCLSEKKIRYAHTLCTRARAHILRKKCLHISVYIHYTYRSVYIFIKGKKIFTWLWLEIKIDILIANQSLGRNAFCMRYSCNNVASLLLEEFRTRSINDTARLETDQWIERSIGSISEMHSQSIIHRPFCVF